MSYARKATPRLLLTRVEHSRVTIPGLVEELGVRYEHIHRALRHLERAGCVRRAGTEPRPAGQGRAPFIWEAVP